MPLPMPPSPINWQATYPTPEILQQYGAIPYNQWALESLRRVGVDPAFMKWANENIQYYYFPSYLLQNQEASKQYGGLYWERWGKNKPTILLWHPTDESILHETAHGYAAEGGLLHGLAPGSPMGTFAAPNPPLRQDFRPQLYNYAMNPPNNVRSRDVANELLAVPNISPWEMYASLASGTMGNTNPLPPDLSRYYRGFLTGNPLAPWGTTPDPHVLSYNYYPQNR